MDSTPSYQALCAEFDPTEVPKDSNAARVEGNKLESRPVSQVKIDCVSDRGAAEKVEICSTAKAGPGKVNSSPCRETSKHPLVN